MFYYGNMHFNNLLKCIPNFFYGLILDVATLDWDNYVTIFDDIDCNEGYMFLL
jgi:hypothetical protein